MSTRRKERQAAEYKRNILVVVLIALIINIVIVFVIATLTIVGVFDFKNGKITIHNDTITIEDKMSTFVMPTDNSVAVRANAVISHFIEADMSDYQKVKVIHDFLVEWTTYDWAEYTNKGNNSSAHKEYGVFIKGKAVCNGYAASFKLLCELADIESEIVIGKENDIFTKGNHVWNTVKIDSSWYQLDITWNDTVMEQLGSEKILYDYFLVTDDIMEITHAWDDNEYERCNSEEYLYKAYKDMGIAATNSVKLRSIFDKQYKEGSTAISMMYTKQGLPSLDFIAESYGNYNWSYKKIGDDYRITVIINE